MPRTPRPAPLPAGPGQESVWAYPRPAVCEPEPSNLKIVLDGRVLADTRKGFRTLETSHPPNYYFPRADVDMTRLRANARRSLCEWKGQASYFDVLADRGVLQETGWSYTSPTRAFEPIKEMIAFYAGPFDGCFVDGERVTAQPGGFYGGWITSSVVGPFKGEPGTMGW